MRPISHLSEFGAYIIAKFITSTTPPTTPTITRIIPIIKKHIQTENPEEIQREIIKLIKEGKIPMGDLVEIIRETLNVKTLHKTIFEGPSIEYIPLVLDQLSFYYSNTNRELYEELLKFRDVILSELGLIRRLVSYYYIPRSIDEVRDLWRLPKYIDSVILKSPRLERAMDEVWSHIQNGENTIIIGDPGVGKTVALYASLIDMFYNKGTNIGVILHGSHIGKIHEEEGFILFMDDAPKNRVALEDIYHNSVHNIVATARFADWRELSDKLKKPFKIVILEPPDEKELGELIEKYSYHFGIIVEDNAKRLIIDKCRGSPIYIRYIFENASRKGIRRIDKNLVSSVPPEMYEYVASIIGEIFFEDNKLRRGAYGAALALRILGDLKDSRVNERVFDKIYDLSSDITKNTFGDTTNFDLYLRMKEHLARDPELNSIGYPHDIWGDIIIKKNTKHKIAKLISLIESKIPYRQRVNIIKNAFESTHRDIEEEYRILGDKVAKDRFSIAYYAELNKEIIGEVIKKEEIKKDAESHSELTISRILLISTPPTIEKPPTVIITIGNEEYTIEAKEFEIGRNKHGPNIQIRYGKQTIDTSILDMTVSKKHLKVTIENKKVYVIDLGSKNGTWINNKKLTPNKKVQTNEVKIGGYGLKIKIRIKQP